MSSRCDWFFLNWSPPNADTHGLIPPVPSAIKPRPVIVKILEGRCAVRITFCSSALHVQPYLRKSLKTLKKTFQRLEDASMKSFLDETYSDCR